MLKRIAGTKDILPPEVLRWQELEALSRRVFSLYNFREIRPPLLEQAALFNRCLGEGSEIIQKQMFLLHNKDELYCLRPEATASVVRAYLENSLDKEDGFAKFYYLGPMFRLERPQKGRLRQFHHIGCEAVGSYSPALDVELISLAAELLRGFGISDYEIKLNSLGCPKDKAALADTLRGRLLHQSAKLCPDCQLRLRKNALRILDCKNDACKEIVSGLNLEGAHLCPECQRHFLQVKEGLQQLEIKFTLAQHLVRGLDYYTRTVFEISHSALGAQDALGAGGRYDNLVKELGGPDLGAIGFAFGVERLLLATSHKPQATSKNLVYLITLGEEARTAGIKLLAGLRKAEIPCDTDYEGKSLKGALRKANDLGARFALLLGEDELRKNVVMLKDMLSGEQKEIKREEIVSCLMTNNKAQNSK